MTLDSTQPDFTSGVFGAPTTMFAGNDFGAEVAALAWLVGDVDGDGQDEVVQLWANGIQLGMTVFEWAAGAMSVQWTSADTGAGMAALSWQIGDVDGDGQDEVIQLWSSGSYLGMTVFEWTGSEMSSLWSTDNVGQGYGAVGWLVGDVNGDGQDEVVQVSLDTSAHIAYQMVVYNWFNGAMSTLWSNPVLGGSPLPTIGWLIGDVDGDGQDEIVQTFTDDQFLGMIVYGWWDGGMRGQWYVSNVGQGYGALAWLVGDVDGDGQDEVIQPWANGQSLGMIVYRWNPATQWSTASIGQGPAAAAWLVGDVNGDGQDEVIQPWVNGSSLGMIVYGWSNGQMSSLSSTSSIVQNPSGTVAWLLGDVTGGSGDEIVQLWGGSGGSLGMNVYGYPSG